MRMAKSPPGEEGEGERERGGKGKPLVWGDWEETLRAGLGLIHPLPRAPSKGIPLGTSPRAPSRADLNNRNSVWENKRRNWNSGFGFPRLGRSPPPPLQPPLHVRPRPPPRRGHVLGDVRRPSSRTKQWCRNDRRAIETAPSRNELARRDTR